MVASAAKRAWVTGAGKGIGRAVSLALARKGYAVAASARTLGDLQSLAGEAAGAPGRIVPYPLDVTDEAAVKDTVRRIEADLGALDLALLNAGTHDPTGAANFDSSRFRKVVDINLMGVVHGLDALLPGFRQRRHGHVAVVASVAGYRGLPSASAYGATKAALINLCESLRPELERDGVKLQVICPGFVDTPLTQKNDFPMPFIIPVDKAAEFIMKGLDSSRFEIVFPRRMAVTMKILRHLPNSLLFTITKRINR